MLSRSISNASGHPENWHIGKFRNTCPTCKSQNHRRLSENPRGTLIARMMSEKIVKNVCNTVSCDRFVKPKRIANNFEIPTAQCCTQSVAFHE